MSILGKKVTDRITGFHGTAIGYVTYISGCNQVAVAAPVDKDGKMSDAQWVDEQRLVVDEDAPVIKLDNTGGRGFDRGPVIR